MKSCHILIYNLCPIPNYTNKTKDYISECADFSLNSQSVSFLQAYLLLELISSALLAETGSKFPLVFSVTPVDNIELLKFWNVCQTDIGVQVYKTIQKWIHQEFSNQKQYQFLSFDRDERILMYINYTESHSLSQSRIFDF